MLGRGASLPGRARTRLVGRARRTAWVLVEEPDAHPVGYGELWLDEEEDEVELARLIVDPARRRSGLGRALVTHLVAAAAATGLSGCLLRVVPDNAPAIALYRAAGFAAVDPERAAEWNQGQPTDYLWFEWVSR